MKEKEGIFLKGIFFVSTYRKLSSFLSFRELRAVSGLSLNEIVL